jgi:hypothetical protein
MSHVLGECCPRCHSPQPHLHPAVQFEGEVQPCSHAFHLQVTPANTPERIAEAQAMALADARGTLLGQLRELYFTCMASLEVQVEFQATRVELELMAA